MKKYILITCILFLISISTIPVYAMGGGMGGMGGGMGSGMTGDWGTGLLNLLQKWKNEREYSTPDREPWRQGEYMNRQQNEDSIYLEYQIQMKEKQLDALLEEANPDIDKVRKLHKDIQDLRSLYNHEQHNYGLDESKLNRGNSSQY